MKKSIWQSASPEQLLPHLTESKSCDVCVIGGGLTGIYTALKLAQRGFHVILLESNKQLAQGTTGLSTGKVTTQHGLLYSKLTEQKGRTYYQAQQEALEQLFVELPSTLLHHTDSYLYATTTQGEQSLHQEHEAYRQLGIQVALTNDTELEVPIKSALQLKNQAQVNPVELTQYFAQLAQNCGVEIYGDIQVTHINSREKYVSTSKALRIQYQNIILCTHYPITSFQQLLILKLAVNRSYLMAAPIKKLWQGQYLSTDDHVRTSRTTTLDGQNYLIYGGGSHLAGTISATDDYYKILLHELQQQFDISSITSEWSAQDVTTVDLLPYVGQLAENLYIATGFRKWGLSNSIVAGEILTATICNEQHVAQKLFNPHRKAFGKSLLKVMAQTGFVTTQLILGYSTRVNAPKCTHLGCKTRWNKADQTWDCPCHGSRYNAVGEVIEGPAVYPLKIKTDTHSHHHDTT